MKTLLNEHIKHRKLQSLVENKTTYHADFAELNIYETHRLAERVHLRFDFPIIASMLSGKKVMHLEGNQSFEFYPGESVVMPAHDPMIIDFPDATMDDPTQCLALGIDTTKIREVVNRFNSLVRVEDENDDWQIDEHNIHLRNNDSVNILVSRLVQTFTATDRSKDVLIDLMIQELIVRLLQTKAKTHILSDPRRKYAHTRIGHVIEYIKKNLTNKDLSIASLAEKAYMSSSHFHKTFKNTLGISPIDYVNSEKIKFAKQLMRKCRNMNIGQVALQSGFNNASYFNRIFKKYEKLTPQQYRKQEIYT